MITGYIPNKEHIIEVIFGSCSHNVVNDTTPPFCDKCNSFVFEKDVENMEMLEDSLLNKEIGIGGGPYVAKLVNFLAQHGNLYFSSTKGTFWYGLCYVIPKDKSGSINITYKSRTTDTFAYGVCWLAEILFRRLLDENYSEKEIRRKINDS